MDKQKRNQVIGAVAVGSVLLCGSIYGLARQPDSFVAQWFNLQNDSNSTNDRSKSSEENGSNKEVIDPKAYNSKEAKEANANSKFEANKDESWKLDSIYRKPVHSDYVYDSKAKRVSKNDTGVSSVDSYKRQIEIYSTVKANTQYRNAKDETYEKSKKRFIEAISLLQKEYLSQLDTKANRFDATQIDKIKIQYFASDFSSMKQFSEASVIAKGMKLDESTFKLRYTSSDGVYAFEGMLNSEKTGEQVMYMSGFYNEKLNYFQVKAAIYMMDGAVEKDKYFQDFSHSYQTSSQ